MDLAHIFVSNHGVRAGWRILLWLALALGINAALEYPIYVLAEQHHATAHAFLDPRWMLVSDAAVLIAALAATWIAARAEHLTLRDYYIPTRNLFGRHFWHGLLWGFLAVSALIGLIAAFRGYRVAGLAIRGRPLLFATLLWLAASLAIGIAEEIAFRGYMLRTLADGMRFWPAAILLSAGFGTLHYFTKPYERWEDFASTGLLGLFGCLTIRRTGSLAFMIGWHAAFDWGALFFYSGRNAGEFATGHLLDTSWTGPDWLTGGMLGPEASWLIGIVIALLFALFSRFYPPSRPADSSSAAGVTDQTRHPVSVLN